MPLLLGITIISKGNGVRHDYCYPHYISTDPFTSWLVLPVTPSPINHSKVGRESGFLHLPSDVSHLAHNAGKKTPAYPPYAGSQAVTQCHQAACRSENSHTISE